MSTQGPVSELLVDKHAQFVIGLDSHKDTFEHWTMQHLRISGIYWGAGAMHVMQRLDRLPKDEIIKFALSCQNPDGGFGGATGQDSHLLYTLSAVQVLCIFEAESQMNVDAVCRWTAALQQPDGSFAGDQWGEID